MEAMDTARRYEGAYVLKVLLAAALAMAMWLSWALPAHAVVPGMQRVSAGPYVVDDDSLNARISADGRYVVFESAQMHLIAGLQNTQGLKQIYRWDRLATDPAKKIEAVTVDTSGVLAGKSSHTPSISGDGRYVVFASEADDLTTATVGGPGTYVRDMVTHITKRVDLRPDGSALAMTTLSNKLYFPAISRDGTVVVFMSSDPSLTQGASFVQVFRRNLVTSDTVEVSVSSALAQGNGQSTAPSISDDGLRIAFASLANNLVAADNNLVPDVFVRDLGTGETTRVSVDAVGGESLGGSSSPVISGNGKVVAFVSAAPNLVAGGSGINRQVFVKDTSTNAIQRVSTQGAAEGDHDSYNPGISADGKYVSFQSDADNLAPFPGKFYYGAIFLFDRVPGVLTRTPNNVDFGGSVSGQVGQNTGFTSMSADGRFVAFDALTNVPNALVSPESPTFREVFLYDSRPQVPAVLYTPKISTSRPRHNVYFYMSGTVSKDTGAKAPVQLKFYRWVKSGSKYVWKYYVTRTTYTASGQTTYKYKGKLPYTGKWYVRAYHPADTQHLLSWSAIRYFTVYT
jgi:hypothetical protein